MKPESLLGVWTGNVHHSNGWDMKITISVLQPFEVGSTLGIFDIPLIPCSGTFRVLAIRGETVEVYAEKQQGECLSSVSDNLEYLADGSLLYISKGRGWEIRGVLHRND
jgi:hypothetical protein